ncbi:hypothetical protein QCA50_015084 [Cerrena zonata]|uniref:Uncharacterized protein n=1 Tax=Cerrena zonata TaxID=2478898 RepID=A0AAW0FR32_9APHY
MLRHLSRTFVLNPAHSSPMQFIEFPDLMSTTVNLPNSSYSVTTRPAKSITQFLAQVFETDITPELRPHAKRPKREVDPHGPLPSASAQDPNSANPKCQEYIPDRRFFD